MEKKSIFVKFDDNQLKYENHQTSRMSADSSMGAQTSNEVDVVSMNEINDAPWNPVEDVLPVDSVQEVKAMEPVSQAEPVKEETQEPVAQEQVVQVQSTQEQVPAQVANLRVEIPNPSESDDDMPPLVSSSENSEEELEDESSDSKEESDDSKDESSESKEESDDSKDESSESKEESDDSGESEESKDSDDDLMVAVFQRPTCPRCDAALKALLTPSEDESESLTESSTDSGSPRSHRLRATPTQIPMIIITLFKILLFLHIIQFLTNTFAPARRTYS